MKKFVITEQEKKQIRGLYNLDEQMSSDFFNSLLSMFGGKNIFGKSDSGTTSSDDSDTKDDDVRVENGKVKIVGNFDSEQLKNINYLIDEMNNQGITDPYAQIGILSVINKESGFVPKNEFSYSKTSNQRLRKLFGKRLSKYSDSELNSLKSDDRKFFNVIYAKTVGNQGGDDGYRYRGRGFNQLTGIKNYERYSNLIGMGNKLVEDPDLVNDTKIAAKIAIVFLTNGKSGSSLPKFDSKKEAASYFADVNAGGSTSHRAAALEKTKNFEVA
jgi:predicted chitinase